MCDRPIPYIGITDFLTSDQAEAMIEVFRRERRKNRKSSDGRALHVGGMTSYKAITGESSRYAKTFPPKEHIESIFRPGVGESDVLNCLHFVHYEAFKEEDDWFLVLGGFLSDWVPYVDAVQLDMIWPDPAAILTCRDIYRRHPEFILQIGEKAFECVGGDPGRLVDELADYVENDAIHRVLLDRSMGKGKPMSDEDLLPFLRALRENFPQLGLGVAGGLGPDTLHLLGDIPAEFPDISIDAQGKLRPSGDALNELVNWQMAEEYFIGACKLFA